MRESSYGQYATIPTLTTLTRQEPVFQSIHMSGKKPIKRRFKPKRPSEIKQEEVETPAAVVKGGYDNFFFKYFYNIPKIL